MFTLHDRLPVFTTFLLYSWNYGLKYIFRAFRRYIYDKSRIFTDILTFQHWRRYLKDLLRGPKVCSEPINDFYGKICIHWIKSPPLHLRNHFLLYLISRQGIIDRGFSCTYIRFISLNFLLDRPFYLIPSYVIHT